MSAPLVGRMRRWRFNRSCPCCRATPSELRPDKRHVKRREQRQWRREMEQDF